jgi:hypothetical protein
VDADTVRLLRLLCSVGDSLPTTRMVRIGAADTEPDKGTDRNGFKIRGTAQSMHTDDTAVSPGDRFDSRR